MGTVYQTKSYRTLLFTLVCCVFLTTNQSIAKPLLWLSAQFKQAPPSISACMNYFLNKAANKMDHWVWAQFKTEEELIQFFKRTLAQRPIRNLDGSQMQWLKEHPVYISVTTTPLRIKRLHHVLETLDLTHVEQVFISIPEAFARTGKPYIIPESLSRMHKITILRPAQDEGPASKILTAAEYLREREPNAFLISIDDDDGYPAGMVNELIYAAYHVPNAVIGGGGQTFDRFGIHAPLTQQNKLPKLSINQVHFMPSDLVEGYAGVIYPVSKIPIEDIRAFIRHCKECFVSDDMVISLALEKHEVPRYRVISPYYAAASIRSFPYGDRLDALKNGAGSGNHETQSVHFRNYRIVFNTLRSDIW